MNCSRPPRSAAAATTSRTTARALTLVEVVAGLALMATILASLLYARVRYARNLALADARAGAIAAADALLTEWANANKPAPPAADGEVAGEPRLRWQTRVIDNDAARRAQSRVVRLTIRRADAAPTSTPLASVEVLEPMPVGKGNR